MVGVNSRILYRGIRTGCIVFIYIEGFSPESEGLALTGVYLPVKVTTDYYYTYHTFRHVRNIHYGHFIFSWHGCDGRGGHC